MERRFVLFLVLSFAILFGYQALMIRLRPPRKPADVAAKDIPEKKKSKAPEAKKDKEPEKAPAKPEAKPDAAEPAKKAGEDVAPKEAAPAAPVRRWITLGSADPADPYRMLVTLTSRGAAIARVELSSPRYRALEDEDRSGYLGHLVVDELAAGRAAAGKGALVQIVGPGTPAAVAGLKAGDLIVGADQQKITSFHEFEEFRRGRRPGQQIALAVLRGDQRLSLPVTLRHRPLELIRPDQRVVGPNGKSEWVPIDHLSMLVTLQSLDGRQIVRGENVETVEIGNELGGLDLWSSDWELLSPASSQTEAVFRRLLPKEGLEITKTYRLAKVPGAEIETSSFRAYHLLVDVKIRNASDRPHKVAYQLDGPNGLPTEGWWYATKVGRDWGAVGLCDLVVSYDGGTPKLIGAPYIADSKVPNPWQGETLSYIGVDAQYFSAVVIPQRTDANDQWIAQSYPLRIGPIDPARKNLTNTSCRIVSQEFDLDPGASRSHEYLLFAGPKSPDVLAEYDLGELIYYGWFGWLAVPMTQTLHVFYAVVYNYGLAILMLTVLVRGAMFPLSRKQALGAQKMQELQPEIKKIQEKYKKDVEARTKAQQELFRKHKYNPLSGCLVLFIQLPVFVALYQSLRVDIALRGAPLISQGLRWCSDLSAPDMLFDWSGFMPQFVNAGVGMFGLGPYFNILPLLTVVLFIVQQKMFMPPPADEQAAMQQKIMQYMMIFIGLMFFKVASGLCIYFIASSLWGLAERKFLPKTAVNVAPTVQTRADAKAQARAQQSTNNGGASAQDKRKNRPAK